MTNSVIMSAHRHTSPNGKGLCGYTVRYGTTTAVCGKPADHVVHSPDMEDPVAAYLDRSQAYQALFGEFPLDNPPTMLQGLLKWYDENARLAAGKNKSYRNAWQEQGYMGNLARILSKAARLKAMLWHDQAVETMTTEELEALEPVADTLRDLANLCYFAARNIEEGNRWGSNG